MVVYDFINYLNEPDGVYIDEKLLSGLNKIKERVNKKDFDQVFLIDGPEGCGKSVFGMQLGKILDPTLELSRVCMKPEEFVHSIQTAEKGQVIIYDEAYTGFAARHSLSKINKLLVSMMMEMRQKNLIVLIILPTFFMLDKYVAVFRSSGLFHLYLNHGKRGFWLYYNQRKKKLLYILGKKFMSYTRPKTNFKGQFRGKYVLNEEAYRKKKDLALKNRDTKKIDDTVYKSREGKLITLISGLLKESGIKSFRKQSTWFSDVGWPIHRARLTEIVRENTENKANLAG